MNTHRPHADAKRAFTLIELLVVIAIIALLVSVLMPSLAKANALAKSSKCMLQLRQIGQATQVYAEDSQETLPRSQMSAAANNTQPWEKAIIPFVGGDLKDVISTGANTAFMNSFVNGLYRCPSDTRPLATDTSTEANYKLSYGENGSFELDATDPYDYPGKPATWHKISQTPRPFATVFYGELSIKAVMNDHFMPYFWSSDAEAAKEIDGMRHQTRSHYVFVDGHIESRMMSTVFLWNDNPDQRIDRLNPMLAAQH